MMRESKGGIIPFRGRGAPLVCDIEVSSPGRRKSRFELRGRCVLPVVHFGQMQLLYLDLVEGGW